MYALRSSRAYILAFMTLVGCDRGSSSASQPAPAPTKEAKAEPTPAPEAKAERAAAKSEVKPKAMTNTGVLSEEAFKALHEHRDGNAPAPTGEMIELDGTGAYLSLPPGAKTPVPAVVVIHEWWGLNGHIKHWADRLAADGYAALAVDLYGTKVATTPDEAMALMKSVDNEAARKTLGAAHRFLAEDPRIAANKRGVIGWCFGGGWSLQHALSTPDLDAAVVYYGRLVDDPQALSSISAPVLGVFGNLDEGIPPASVDAFEGAMKEAGRPLKVLRFDAPHAFANPSSKRYREEAAASAWTEVRAFLAENLRGS